MEVISLIIGYIFIFWVIGAVFRGIFRAINAAGRKVTNIVTGKETYFGPPQIKFVDEKLPDTDLIVKRIMFRGRPPVTRSMQLSFAVSALDSTDGDDDLQPVISLADGAQEENSACYFQGNTFGQMNVGASFTDWVQLGVICPELIQAPWSGKRQIELFVRLFNTADAPHIHAGYSDGRGDLVWIKKLKFEHNFIEKGYKEASLHRQESQAIALKIGVAVAMADGELDDSEGDVLKHWIIKEISPFSDEKKAELRGLYNEALKEAYADAETGNLSLSLLVDRLAEVGEKKSKYDAIELCFDVMAADGVADPEEMSVIRRVAEALELDMGEIESMREKVTLNLSTELTSEAGLESLVGLEVSWSDERKRKHLRTEFQKWSNRLNSLPEGEERDQAQNMLDNIAVLRKKYG
tara:strand:+ start:110 stop:1336 length:1227 start_codon:yes stop_codon:yes gene_type:complete